MKLLVKTAVAALAVLGSLSAAHADGIDMKRHKVTRYKAIHQYDSIRFACENGRAVTLQPRAVTVDGDVVTGHLYTSPRRGAKVRLIPMGDGYRYAGRGIWLDGIRGDATLHLGKYASTGCQRVI